MKIKDFTFPKKSQMEILGLAIVFVLILVATLFVVKFLALNKPTDYRTGFVASELASNMLNTFLKTTASDCSKLDMTTLIRDCAVSKGIVCSNGQDSCAYAEETARTIFSQTLEEWNYEYEFEAYIDSTSPFIIIGDKCQGEARAKFFPISIGTVSLQTKLELCI